MNPMHKSLIELWLSITDNPDLVGDRYVFVAMDSETKLVSCFRVGKLSCRISRCVCNCADSLGSRPLSRRNFRT